MTEIEEKFELWKRASDFYYNKKEPIMSDIEFDLLSEWLQNNGTYDVVDFMNTHIMGKDGFIKINNETNKNIGMQVSLKKIKWKGYGETPSDIFKFIRTYNPRSITTIWVGPKFDGCSININFDTDGIKSRGGQDLTAKLRYNKSILMWMSFVKQQIREGKYPTNMLNGELVIRKSIFEEKYSEDYKNPRNFVSGVINSNECDPNILNDLEFCPYTDGMNIFNRLKITLATGEKMMCWQEIPMSNAGFVNFNIEKYFETLKTDFPYLCDGIVLAVHTDTRNIVDNYPTNMVAVKFRTETARSRVIDIEWSQKKSVKLNPVCILEPVKLFGTEVNRASAYNYRYLLDNNIGIGSVVEITKSGDIIPCIIKTIVASKEIKYPDIAYIIEGKNLVATEESDISYRAKFLNAIKRLDIKGIGESLSDDIGLVVNYDIIELFNPERKLDIMSTLGINSANWRTFSKIYDIKTLTYADVIYMLQFRQVGNVLCERISRLLTKQSTDISNIPEYVLNHVCRQEGFQKIKESVTKLRSYGIKITANYDTSEYKTFEMTGEPPEMTKDQFAARLKVMIPNSQHTTLTKTTSFLITNDLSANTSKMMKARKYNIPIITYEQALKNKELWK